MSVDHALALAGALFPPRLRAWVQIVVKMAFCNPFSPERIAYEKEALPPDEFVDTGWAWSLVGDVLSERVNGGRLRARLQPILDVARARLAAGFIPSDADRELYVDACLYLLYDRYDRPLLAFIDRKPVLENAAGEPAPEPEPPRAGARGRRRGASRADRAAQVKDAVRRLSAEERAAQAALFGAFLVDYETYLVRPWSGLRPPPPERTFDRFYQVRRAFHYIYVYIVGTSRPAANLRMRLWEAIFTSDMRDYLKGTQDCLDDVHTLVLGESGTGKEGVARALGRSGYLPFLLPERHFAAADGEHYHCLSLVDRASTLVHGELFGYDAGAFTGAERDTPGWLELCPSGGRLFLDEIAELDVSLQVMLLRVIQSRTFQRLGSRVDRMFQGRILAATNQDLRSLIAAGKFRDELYQRLAVDEIRTPTLREQLADAPDDLHRMVEHIALRMRGADQGAELARKALPIIQAKRGRRYGWPGNFRELERTVRRIYVHDVDAHGSPSTQNPGRKTDAAATALGLAILEGEMKMGEIERVAIAAMFKKTQSRREGARRLGIDRERFTAMLREVLGDGTAEKGGTRRNG
jgi:transcriptional regulator with AAA-type ATPase domain